MANTVEIIIKQSGQGNAISTTIKDLDRLGSAANSSGGLLGGFGKTLSNVFGVAGGIVAADIFRNIASSITGLVSTALGEFARYERMALSVQSLVARELSQGQQVEVQRQVLAGLTKKEADELGGLADKIKDEELSRNTLRARIMEQSEALRQLRDAHGNEALDVQTATARLAELENQYNESGKEIDNMKNRMTELGSKEGQLVTVMDKVRTGQIDMNTAMEQAGPRAAELLSWISKLAVMSPFNEQGIQDAFQTALAYGFTTEAAQRLTEAEVDFTSATGKSIEQANLIALALGQMQAKGKVSGQELIQLTNAGIGVNKILEGMGFTLDDVSNGLVDSDKFIEAVIKDMEIFEGAAADQASTFSGLISTLGDLKAIGLREFFTGTFTAIQPYLADFVGMLTSAALETGSIRRLGDVFGQYVGAGLQKAAALATSFYESIQKVIGAFQRFGVRGATVSILGQLGLEPEQIASVMGVVDQVTGAIDKITGAFQRFGLKGATVSILGMLGMDPETIGLIRTTFDEIVITITESFDKISGAYERFGAMGAAVSIMGQLGLDPETIGAIFTTIDTIIEKITTLQTIFAQFGAMGAGVSLLSMMGLSSESIALITTSIQAVMDSLTGLANWWLATWPTVQAAALTGWEILKGIFAGFQTALGPILTQLNIQFTQVFSQIGAILASFGISWSDVWNALATATGIVATVIGAAILGVIGVVAGLATGIAEGVSAAITMFQNLATNVSGIVTGLVGIVVGFNQTLYSILTGDFANAWEGAKVLLQGFATFFSNLWGGMITVAVGSLDILASSISGFAEGVVSFFQGMYNQLIGHSIIPDLINGIVKWFQGLPQKIVGALGGLVSKVTTLFTDLMEEAESILTSPSKWLEIGEMAMEGLQNGLEKASGVVLEYLKSLLGSFLDIFTGPSGLDSQSPSRVMIGIGKDAIMGLKVGVENTAKTLNQTAQGVVNSIIDPFTQAGRSIMQRIAAGAGLEGGSVKNAILSQLDFAAKWFKKKESLGDAERAGAKQALFDAFEQTYGGIVAGTAGRDEFLNAFRQGLKGNVFDATEMGEALGVAADHVDEIINTIRSQFGPLTLEMKAQAVSMAQSFSSLAAGFAGMVQNQIEGAAKAKEEAAKLGEANVKLTETLGTQQEKMVQFQADLLELTSATELDTEAIKRKQAAITDLSEAIAKNQETITENEEALKKHRQELEQKSFARFNTTQGSLEGDLATIELLQDFLKGTASEFLIPSDAASQAAGITGILYDRVFAQQELNRLLAEQAERERQIAEQQKAQQQLSFLQQQVDLLKQGQALGINVFEGMTFGLNASASDLLAATNALVNAMVAEIDSSLQIASPSKVMFDKFRNQVGGGMVRGLMAVKPILSGVIEPMLSPLTGDYSKTTNNNFSMTVNTRAEQSSVIGDFRTMQLMAG